MRVQARRRRERTGGRKSAVEKLGFGKNKPAFAVPTRVLFLLQVQPDTAGARFFGEAGAVEKMGPTPRRMSTILPEKLVLNLFQVQRFANISSVLANGSSGSASTSSVLANVSKDSATAREFGGGTGTENKLAPAVGRAVPPAGARLFEVNRARETFHGFHGDK